MKRLITILMSICIFFSWSIPAFAAGYSVNPFYAIESYEEYINIKDNLGTADHMYYGWARIARDSNDKMVFTSSSKQLSIYDVNKEYRLPSPVAEGYPNEIHKSLYPNSHNLLMVFFSTRQYDDGKNSAVEFLNMTRQEWEANIITPMANMLSTHDFDGVVLDFEGFVDKFSNTNYPEPLNSGLREKYNSFLSLLKSRLQDRELLVCANVSENYDGYDYKHIYNIADSIILLSYPHTHFTEYTESDGIPELVGKTKSIDIPEPQPFDKIDNSLKKLVEILKDGYGENYYPKKIVLGATIETNGWVQKEFSKDSKNYTYYERTKTRPKYSEIENAKGIVEYILQSNPYKYQSMTYRKTVTQGLEAGVKKIEYYYETPETIYDKFYTLVLKYNLSGMSVWRIGIGSQNLWESIYNIFNTPYEELAPKSEVSPDKTWTIKFNMALDEKSIKASQNSIWITDSTGIPQEINLEYDAEQNSVRVIPVNSYNKGEVYYLIIGGAVKSGNGKNLSKPSRMKFKITQ